MPTLDDTSVPQPSHSHDGHTHDSGSYGSSQPMEEGSVWAQGSPKIMFALGLCVGIAVCTTAALAFTLRSISTGSGFLAAQGGTAAQQVAAAPGAPTPSQPTPDAQQPTAPSGPVKPVDEKVDHIRGPKDAKVTMIEYSDFQCPFCSRHHTTLQQIMKDYDGKVRLVYRHFPLSFHPFAQKLAEASECVAAEGGNEAFFKYHDKVFEEMGTKGESFTTDRITQIAKEIGMDEKKIKDCVDSGKMAARVAQDQQEGGSAGVEGTPATFVNGKLVSGAVPLAQFKSMIDAALK